MKHLSKLLILLLIFSLVLTSCNIGQTNTPDTQTTITDEDPTTEEPTTEAPTTEDSTTTDDSGNEEEPDDPYKLSIEEAIALGLSHSHNTFTSEKYYVTGEITEIYNTTYGNMRIKDEDGNILTIYGSYNADGTIRFSSMANKPSVGDTITLYGIIGQYNGTAQMKNGWIMTDADNGSSNNGGSNNGGSDNGGQGGNIQLPNENDPITSDPYANMSAEDFYANYKPAVSYMDAYYRSLHGFMSGSIDDQDKVPTTSEYQPVENGLYIRNYSAVYSEDGNTYYVYDAYGNIAYEIYRGGGYVTLEEVAAYVFAFQDIPANYLSGKKGDPKTNMWGEYLRLNHSNYSNNVENYPYEPELPIEYRYKEIDIGTTGSGNATVEYNNGTKITRGAARIVYGTNDKDGDGVIESNEILVFYTYNHYNDFQEYLNYEGGWGQRFGNETGGGVHDSKTQCNPTPYVITAVGYFATSNATVTYEEIAFIDMRNLYYMTQMCA